MLRHLFFSRTCTQRKGLSEMEELLGIQEKLRSVLKKKRFEHTLGVRYTAGALAMCHGVDLKRAQLAGLLHDCAKHYTDEQLLQTAKKNNIEVSSAERRSPQLLHAKMGALLAKQEYGVEDEKILNAIRFHTTGKPDMTDLEKIIFIADYIEPNRRMLEQLPKCRKLAYENLDNAMYEILKSTLSYLESKGADADIDSTTYAAYKFYEKMM